jgi:hypothetical protein
LQRKKAGQLLPATVARPRQRRAALNHPELNY